MTRYLIIAAALLSLPPLTDWLVDHQLHRLASEPVGYTRQERDAMSRLVERSIAAPVTHVCGENWLCLLQWSEEQHPTKQRRRS